MKCKYCGRFMAFVEINEDGDVVYCCYSNCATAFNEGCVIDEEATDKNWKEIEKEG